MTNKQIKRAVEICKEKAVKHMFGRYWWLKFDRYEIDKFNAIHIYFTDMFQYEWSNCRTRVCQYVFMLNSGEWQIKTIAYG